MTDALETYPVDAWIARGQILSYEELPAPAQLAIAHYMAIDGEAWPRYEDPARYALRFGETQFGAVNVSMHELQNAIMEYNADCRNDHANWDAYHRWYLSLGDVPDHGASVWPVILDCDYGEVLQDGWHRLHDYARKDLDAVPAIFYP